VSVLKMHTVCVNPLYCGNKFVSPTFVPNIKLQSYLEVPSVPLKDKLLFVLVLTKTTINGDGWSLKVATIN